MSRKLNFKMSPADLFGLVILIFAIIISAFIVFGLSGCSPTKRLGRIATNHPEAAAVICDRLFPVKESTRVEVRTKVDTVTIPGTTVFIDCDSARAARPSGDTTRLFVQVPCPPAQLITKMVTKDSIVTVESTAKIASLTNALNAALLANEQLKHSRNTWLWIAVVAGGYLIIKSFIRMVFPSLTFLKYLP